MGGGMTLILSGTNGLSDVDGTAATPAVRGTDANTGMFFPAADTIAFAEGGTEVMRIDSIGNVGIGTSTPGAKLDVNGSILCRAGGGEGGEISLNNPDNASVGVIFDVGVADSARLFGVRNNFSLALGQLAGTGGFIDCYTAGSLRTRIDSGGNLLVGTTTPYGKITTTSATFNPGSNWATTAALSVSGSFGGGIAFVDTGRGYAMYASDFGNDLYIQGATSLTGAVTGGVYINDRATSWSSASDERLKTIIEPITDAANKVSSLRAVIGRYNYEEDHKRHPFLIAQDVQKVLPEAVSVSDKKSEEQYLGVSYTDVIPLLVAAIQEQQAMIEQLKADVAALKGTV
jgi:hypothetical protein